MSSFVPFNRDQAFLLSPDLKSWLPKEDVAHFIVAAVDRVPLGAFEVPTRTGGKPQYHPRLMLALLIHCYAQASKRSAAARTAKQPDRPGQDSDSTLMRRSDAHDNRQACNAQAVVCAEAAQLILATNLVAITADAPSFAQTVLGMEATAGLPGTVLADTGFVRDPAVAALQARGIEPLVAIGRTQEQRPYDFRPPPDPKPVRQITEPWRRAMRTRPKEDDAHALYKTRKFNL